MVTIEKAYTGHISGKPRWVLRDGGAWVNSYASQRAAKAAARVLENAFDAQCWFNEGVTLGRYSGTRRNLYLDWVNNFLTVEVFASYYGIDDGQARKFVNDARGRDGMIKEADKMGGAG